MALSCKRYHRILLQRIDPYFDGFDFVDESCRLGYVRLLEYAKRAGARVDVVSLEIARYANQLYSAIWAYNQGALGTYDANIHQRIMLRESALHGNREMYKFFETAQFLASNGSHNREAYASLALLNGHAEFARKAVPYEDKYELLRMAASEGSESLVHSIIQEHHSHFSKSKETYIKIIFYSALSGRYSRVSSTFAISTAAQGDEVHGRCA